MSLIVPIWLLWILGVALTLVVLFFALIGFVALYTFANSKMNW